MKISVVIIVRNEEKRIKQCLESILNQDLISENEIVIVDGYSSDNTLKIIKDITKEHRFIKLIACKRYGYSYQRNVGARNASGEYILYVSGDTILSGNLLKKYLEMIKQYDVIQGTILNISDNKLFSKIMMKIYPLLYFKNLNTNCEEFSTVNVCIKRDLILNRAFEESLNSFEDKEWFLHYEDSIKYKRLKSGVIYHVVHESFTEYMKKIYKEAKALGEIVRINKDKSWREKLNFFNWIGYTKNMVLLKLICLAVLFILFLTAQKNIFLLIPIFSVLIYKIIYVRKMMHTISKTRERYFSYFIIFVYMFIVETGLLKGYFNINGGF